MVGVLALACREEVRHAGQTLAVVGPRELVGELEGDGRHWYATIVSAEFEGKRPIARHQRVYKTLGEKMHTDEVHALSMKTFTPAEWANQPR